MRLTASRVCLAVSALVCGSEAQIYTFDNWAIPGNRSLLTVFAFYVYSLDESPEKALDAGFVKFSNLLADASGDNGRGTPGDVSEYRSLQVTLLRYKDFWTLIDPSNLCAVPSHVSAGQAEAPFTLLFKNGLSFEKKPSNVYSHTVRFRPTGDDKFLITKTGVYVMTVSNCGWIDKATLSGSVIVKNPYGFLPGNEFHKMPFYGWFSFIYGALAVVWLCLSVRWWKETFQIQNCISGVIILGLVECFVWHILYNDWNKSGQRSSFLFIFAILVTVIKSCFSYMLVLVASLGWGVTRPFLDADVLNRVQMTSAAYIVLAFIREYVLSYRHTHSLSMIFIVGCLVPMSALNGGIFYWVFTALANLIVTLQERRQEEKALIFRRLMNILAVSVGSASFCVLFQVADVSADPVLQWRYQWFFTDGVSHVLFLFVLVAMMYLWSPHKNSQRFAYSSQKATDSTPSADMIGYAVGSQDVEDGTHVWGDEDIFDEGLDDDEEDSFWEATKDAGLHGLHAEEQRVRDSAR